MSIRVEVERVSAGFVRLVFRSSKTGVERFSVGMLVSDAADYARDILAACEQDRNEGATR